jgi:hypothetical protein
MQRQSLKIRLKEETQFLRLRIIIGAQQGFNRVFTHTVSFPQWASYQPITLVKMSRPPAEWMPANCLLSHYAANCRN